MQIKKDEKVTRARIKDVAALAGVSVATASRALAGDHIVTSATQAKVLEAAKALRFRPNSIARDLRSGGVTTAIGYVISDLINPWYSTVAAGAEEVFRKAGLELIVATTESDPQRERLVVTTMLERRVQALLLIALTDDHSYLEGERQLGTPMIFIDRPPVNLTADSISIDNRGGMRQAVNQLISNGHRRIGLLAGQESLWTTQERLHGYQEALKENKIEFDERLVAYTASSENEVNKAISVLFNLRQEPTALISTHNRLTVQLLHSHQGLLSEIAFIGFDDFELADVLGITVIAHDPLELGRIAAQITLDRIANPIEIPRAEVLETKLVQRGSGERAGPW